MFLARSILFVRFRQYMRTLDRGLPDALQMPFVRSAALRRHLVSHLRPESMCSTIMCRPGLQTR